MNFKPAICVLLALLIPAHAPAIATTDDLEDQTSLSSDCSVEITIPQAKEMILDFIAAEEAKEKKAGAKVQFFITASRAILEKRNIERDDKTGNLIWGPWVVRPRQGNASLQTDLKDNGLMAWGLIAQIKQVEGKYRLTNAKRFEVRGPFKTKPIAK